MTELTDPPADDEFELSLFGPGIGEAVLVHFGGGDWVAVDSCVSAGSATPASLEYLVRAGVDPARCIRAVVVSHWHDDHIRGIHAIAGAAPGAKICCSAALNGEEFGKFVSFFQRSATLSAPSGVDEMYELLSLIKSRVKPPATARSAGPDWIRADQCIWRRQLGRLAAVHALSPSSGTITLALQEFAQRTATDLPRKVAVAQTPNYVAAALWIEAGNVRVLLGSDLEESTDPSRGWKAVVSSVGRPPGMAHLFKVPHHGSPTAHSEDVWTQMLEPNPPAVLTTFASGRRPLPGVADIDRLRKTASSLHSTSPPKGWSPADRLPAVEKTLKEVAKHRRVRRGKSGHVRLRCSLADPTPAFQISLGDPARRLF